MPCRFPGATSQPLTYNVDTTAPAFTAGNLVISLSGDSDGSGVYGDNQASPLTLDQITTTGQIVSQMVLPQQTTTNANGVQYPSSPLVQGNTLVAIASAGTTPNPETLIVYDISNPGNPQIVSTTLTGTFCCAGYGAASSRVSYVSARCWGDGQ